MGSVLRLVGPTGAGESEDSRPELMLTYACARQRRRGALARHRRQECDPWAAVDADDPDARTLAHAWARGWEQHEAVLTAVGRGAEAAKAGKPAEVCPYPAYSADEDESFLVLHWIWGWRAKGGEVNCRPSAEVIPLPRRAPEAEMSHE